MSGFKTKLRAIGKSSGLILPKEMLDRMNLKQGDALYVQETRNGYMVTPLDPEFEEFMELTDKTVSEYRNTLKKLAE